MKRDGRRKPAQDRDARSDAQWCLRYLDGSAKHWRALLALRDETLNPDWLSMLWRQLDVDRDARRGRKKHWQTACSARARAKLLRTRAVQLRGLFDWWIAELDDGACLWLWARGWYARELHGWDSGNGASLKTWLYATDFELRRTRSSATED